MRFSQVYFYLLVATLALSTISPGFCDPARNPEQDYAPVVDRFIFNCEKKLRMLDSHTPNRLTCGKKHKRMYNFFSENRTGLIEAIDSKGSQTGQA